MDKPQIIVHTEKSTTCSLYGGLWVPSAAKFVILGCTAKAEGIIHLYELTSNDSVLLKEVKREHAYKCGTFGASMLCDRHLATGNFGGQLQIWDLERMKEPVYEVDAHGTIINAIDGFGGQVLGCGPPEIVTGSRDGLVKLWDPRQKEDPVAVMEPVDVREKRDCWTVAFGNAYNNQDRVICAGYDNGDVKMFDLKKMAVRWEKNLKNGICSVQFDRREIEMNKLVVTTLESKFFVFELRTQHPKKGFASLKEKAHDSTIWQVSHLPQNRDIFMTCGGNGTVCLWKYVYPSERCRKDVNGDKVGVIGKLDLLQNSILTTQPVHSFDWCPDKTGLALATSFDQTFRTIIVTKLSNNL
ncbi:WD domain, G-beta repeat [Nesidiocoris tenuis]|uniref:WD domain, G-beta repeat n=1 Tax=Nesidiocoris tenuis TaxID=355587 RepID=A0ABN7B2L3_9HEMI|nr:WD domain, G-beta repeat [Nesidiocoris tenuis]